MPRDYEITGAFLRAIKRAPNGRQTVSKIDFVRELELVNWHYTPSEANRWITTYTSNFRDISPNEGEERLFHLYNPNGGI